MGTPCLKIINNIDSRAYNHQYENLKGKVHNCSASTYFNKNIFTTTVELEYILSIYLIKGFRVVATLEIIWQLKCVKTFNNRE
jgi:hypothetical protein